MIIERDPAELMRLSSPDTEWLLARLESRLPNGPETSALAISGAVGRASAHLVGVLVGGPSLTQSTRGVWTAELVGN